MSFPSTPITCTGCAFKGVNLHRPIWLIYRLPDGTSVRLGRDFGWCPHCRDVADIEPCLNPVVLKIELAALDQKSRHWAFVVSDLFRRILRQPKHELRRDIENLLGQLQIAEARTSQPRCLECGEEGARPLAFDRRGVAEGFTHDCGGRLRCGGNPDGPRFSFPLEKIQLDVEGRRLRGVVEECHAED
jgi:hypothetical protein